MCTRTQLSSGYDPAQTLGSATCMTIRKTNMQSSNQCFNLLKIPTFNKKVQRKSQAGNVENIMSSLPKERQSTHTGRCKGSMSD